MTEHNPGKKHTDIPSEMLRGSIKAVSGLREYYPHYDTIGALTGVISEKWMAYAPPEARTRGDRRQLRREQERPVSSVDVLALKYTVNALPESVLPEEIDLEELNGALDRKRAKLEAEESRRFNRRNAKVLAGILAATLLGGASTVSYIRSSQIESEQAYEQARMLTTEPSARSYKGWSIEAAPPDQEYVPNGKPVAISTHENLRVSGTDDDEVAIEVEPYTTSEGGDGMRVSVPIRSPFLFSSLLGEYGEFDILRKPDASTPAQELLILTSSADVVLTGPDDKKVVLRIADRTREDATDAIFTFTQLKPAA